MTKGTLPVSAFVTPRQDVILTAPGETDEKGVPKDYHSLFVSYHNMALREAKDAGLPPDYWEWAATNLEVRFWLKDGLSWYDPGKGKFSTLYRSWLKLSMRGEREKYLKYVDQHYLVQTEDIPEWAWYDPEPRELDADDAAFWWLLSLQESLEDAGRDDLIPVLKACLRFLADSNKQVSIKAIVTDTGLSYFRAKKKLEDLRRFITDQGFEELLRNQNGEITESSTGA